MNQEGSLHVCLKLQRIYNRHLQFSILRVSDLNPHFLQILCLIDLLIFISCKRIVYTITPYWFFNNSFILLWIKDITNTKTCDNLWKIHSRYHDSKNMYIRSVTGILFHGNGNNKLSVLLIPEVILVYIWFSILIIN